MAILWKYLKPHRRLILLALLTAFPENKNSPIYVLEKGRIAESGSHSELLAGKGLYYAMWRLQSSTLS